MTLVFLKRYILTVACIFLATLCINSGSTCLSQQLILEPLEWISSKQAIVVQVDSLENLKANVAELELWDHEQVEVIKKFVTGEGFQELLKPAGLSFDIHNADLTQRLLNLSDQLMNQSAFFTIETSSEANVLSWMLALETDIESAKDVQTLIEAIYSNIPGTDSEPPNQELEVAPEHIQTLPASMGHWFLHQGFVFVFGQLRDAEELYSRLNKGEKPKRSFVESRKFLNATSRERLKGFDRGSGNVTIYFDPSIAEEALPFVPEKVWQEFELDSITGSLLQISFPAAVSETDENAILKVKLDGVVTYRLPLPGIHQALLSAPEIEQLPAFPKYLLDVKAVSFNFDAVIKPIEQSFENAYGVGSFEKALEQWGLKNTNEFDVISEFPKAFSGLFVMGEFMYSDGLREAYRLGKVQALGVKDDAKAKEFGKLLSELINRNGKREVLRETHELGGDCWFFTPEEIEQIKNRGIEVRKRQGDPIIDRDKIFYDDHGFAIAEGWFFKIQRLVYENIMNERLGEDNRGLDAMLNRLRKNSEVRPIALNASWPYFWKIKIASAIWEHEKKLRTVGQSFDMSGFDMQLRPMENIQSLDELISQLKIRLATVLSDRVGRSMFTISPLRNGFRVTGGLFKQPEGEW